MERVVANITSDGTVLAKEVVAFIDVALGGIKRWRGYFIQPPGTYVRAGGPYRLTTTDGRSGQIGTFSDVLSSNTERIEFEGIGQFDLSTNKVGDPIRHR